MIAINDSLCGFRFRSIAPEDKYPFMSIRIETSSVALLYDQFPGFLDFNWKQILVDENELNMMVFRQSDGLFVATCSVQRLLEETLELGYDVVKELRGEGIGTKMVPALIELAHDHFPAREIIVRIQKDNIASQRVAEKSGAVFLGMEDAPEVEIIQNYLNSHEVVPNADKLRSVIEQKKHSVMVYRI